MNDDSFQDKRLLKSYPDGLLPKTTRPNFIGKKILCQYLFQEILTGEARDFNRDF